MTGPTSSSCRACGLCCKAISLDHSKTELTALAAQEAQHLRRHPHTHQRADIERLLRDVDFIDRHFHAIDRSQALALNPGLADPELADRCFYICDCLDERGRCRQHNTRPYLCEGYPWYRGTPNPLLLVVRPCGYEEDLQAR